MKLYHGTTSIFQIPDLQKARHNTDFGPGFYVTDKYALANDWLNNKPGKRINYYEVTLSQLTTCNLSIKIFKKANIEWAKFVYNNRHNKVKKIQYALVVGPIADNGLANWFQKIDKKEITWDELATKIKFNRYKSKQFCFLNSDSLKLLKYVGCK